MASLSLDDLHQRLLSLDLMDLDRIRRVQTTFGSRLFSVDEFLRQAQRMGFLTKYQAERLISGETTRYYYGDYKIQYLIGAGSFARVFRCVHKDTGKDVAVKVLRSRFRDDAATIAEFKREGEVGMALRHPNIAEVYEAHETEHDYYMVMEFIEGSTLREMLAAQKNGVLDAKRATRIIYDVCLALEYALEHGYQHRDMKPSNIMVASEGRAVLLDFGLLTDQASTFKTQRAIDYAALERSTHVRRDDKRSDLYFLGAVYYQALTGIAPLGEVRDRSQRLNAGRFKDIKMIHQVVKGVPRSVASVVDKSLKFDPDERYQSPTHLRQDLERVLEQLDRDDVEEEAFEVIQETKVEKAKPTKTIMVVEANSTLQSTFRDCFKSAGFRPLVISNTAYALQRLEDFEVDAVLFNAQTLGEDAVTAFNKLLESPMTKGLPAVLLLNEDQVQWGAKAKRSKKRLAVGMPISMKRLLMVVDKLTKEDFAAKEKKAEEAASGDLPFRLPKTQKPAEPAPEDAKKETKKDAKEVGEDAGDEFPEDAYAAALDFAFETFSLKSKKDKQEAEAKYDDTEIEDDFDDEEEDEQD